MEMLQVWPKHVGDILCLQHKVIRFFTMPNQLNAGMDCLKFYLFI